LKHPASQLNSSQNSFKLPPPGKLPILKVPQPIIENHQKSSNSISET
jgi:hypothetical protein